MVYAPLSSGDFEEQADTGLNLNSDGATTSSFNIHGHKHVAWSGVLASGTWATAVVTLQCSLDGTVWNNTASTLTAVGVNDNIQITTPFVRAKVTTVEGGTGTADFYFIAK